ncbi:hypothetical protein CBM2599_A130033 [Cupriavidus taiwanensis]|uniref:Uncharacterized protein n=1 Tax=Cupriavidus taiwanensis TaxID=164546 RepID=A0A976AH31_9BURK|nr:hypothetical protein CBM2599_A130033 [Cupriavidus taiwanensis]SOY81986.1 hypothetical protein CBM2600_A120604 [Cupriavidus taiwanensis]SPD65160.1 conserved protein of unknown function [Cupriavidus taiwanensis]
MACRTWRYTHRPLSRAGIRATPPDDDPEVIENPVKLRIGAKFVPPEPAVRPRTPCGARRRAAPLLVAARALSRRFPEH